MICTKCKKEIPEGMKFCPSCGEPVSKLQYCPKCGSKLKEGLHFCPKCGNDLRTPNNKPTENVSCLNKTLLLIIAVLLLIIILGIGFYVKTNTCSTTNRSDVNAIDSNESNTDMESDKERIVTLEYAKENGKRIKCKSNYPLAADNGSDIGYGSIRAYSGLVTVPAGEKWVYSRFEISKYVLHTSEGDINVLNGYKIYPIIYYGRDVEGITGWTKSAMCEKEYIPSFSSGERIRYGIRVPLQESCELEMKVIFRNEN